MVAIDVQRVVKSMVPAPHHLDEAELEADEAEAEAAAGPDEQLATVCPELDDSTCDECEAQARQAVNRLAPILRVRSQPLELVLELLECEFDLKHGCAERLFWLAHERGYLTLNQGRVRLGPGHPHQG
jgi:hypothetical protein